MKQITVYSRPACAYCEWAKRLLKTRGLEFEEVDLGMRPDLLQALVKKTGHRTLPQIFIGETFIGGYTELAVLNGSGELTSMLG